MHPKYSVGEVVIIYTTYLKTEATVLESYWSNNTPNIKRNKIVPPGWIYVTDVEANGSNRWTENCLRKKHQKGDYSFSELMSTLKIGEKV